MSQVKGRPEEANNVKLIGHSDLNGWGVSWSSEFYGAVV